MLRRHAIASLLAAGGWAKGIDGFFEGAHGASVLVDRQTRRRRGVEEVPMELQGAGDAIRRLLHPQRQVELGHRLRTGSPLERRCCGEPRQSERRGLDLEREQGLEQGRAAEVALRVDLLHDLLEGQVLMGVGSERHRADPGEQSEEAGPARQRRAQHQGVGEAADQGLQLGVGAAGDGRADGDVLLTGVAAQQGREARQQDHVEGDALGLP